MAEANLVECRIRMFQVGFGDCFLLTFGYDGQLGDGRAVRHVLIDFGSTRNPTNWRDLDATVDAIKAATDGEIDVIALSHRHKDHISGFGDRTLLPRIIAAGYPKLVVRAWTEVPGDPATTPETAVGDKSRTLLKQIEQAQRFALN